LTPDRYAYILIANEKYWKRLCQESGMEKGVHSFVRKNRVAPKAAERLLFYVKKPVMRIQGSAEFLERQTGQTEDMWTKFGSETCFKSSKEYGEFAHDRTDMTFVRFTNFHELDNPKSTEELRVVLGNLQGFRGKYVNRETADQLTL